MGLVCFDEYYVQFDSIVSDPVTGDPLKRFIVYHEEGEERARFVLRAVELTRWEIQDAAKEALRVFQRRRARPARVRLVP